MTIEFYISHEKVKEIFCFSAKKKFPAAVYSKIEKRKSSIFHFRAWFWLIKWLLYDIVSFILAGYQKKKRDSERAALLSSENFVDPGTFTHSFHVNFLFCICLFVIVNLVIAAAEKKKFFYSTSITSYTSEKILKDFFFNYRHHVRVTWKVICI